VTSILLALAIGFLLGVLLMVLLVSGGHEEDLVERVEQEDARRQEAVERSEG